MPLPDMGIACPSPAGDGSIYLASSSEAGIRRLVPVPLPRQARLLAGSGDFQAALELCGRLPEGEGTAKRVLEDSLRLQFGHRLFEGKLSRGLWVVGGMQLLLRVMALGLLLMAGLYPWHSHKQQCGQQRRLPGGPGAV